MRINLSQIGPWHFSSLHPLGQGQIWLELELTNQVVVSAKLDADSQHRSDQKIIEWRDYQQGLALLNRSAWLTPASFEIAYAETCEELMRLTPSPRALALRKVLLKLQLVMANAWWLAALTAELAQDPSIWLSYRKHWQALHESLTGSHLHDGYVRFGGVANDLPEEFSEQLREVCSISVPESDFSRWRGQALITAETVAEFGITGVPVGTSDAMQRANFFRNTLLNLLPDIEQLTASLPSGELRPQLPKTLRVPVGQAIRKIAGGTGDVTLWLHSDGDKSPLRVALHSNSQRAAAGFASACRGLSVTEARLLLATLPITAGELAL